MDWILNFDSSSWILRVLDQHWLVLGFAWGVFKIIAKRTKGTADDELVSLVEDLRHERKKMGSEDKSDGSGPDS